MNSVFYRCFFLQNEWTDNVIGFHMPTYRACKTLWKTCVEYHTFYRYVLRYFSTFDFVLLGNHIFNTL